MSDEGQAVFVMAAAFAGRVADVHQRQHRAVPCPAIQSW